MKTIAKKIFTAAAMFFSLSLLNAADAPTNAVPIAATSVSAEILTPPAPKTPRINGPKIFGVRPGSPFLYTIPATGARPMTFSADKLPRGLS